MALGTLPPVFSPSTRHRLYLPPYLFVQLPMSVTSSSKGSYAFVSLGCPKNLVDSERMLGLLQLDGYRLIWEPADADFVIVNTCGFIESARQESCGAIEEMLDLKREGKIRGLIVSGCLAQRQQDSLLETYPEIDHLVGVFGRGEITKVADRLLGNQAEQRSVFRPAPIQALSDRDRLRVTPRHFAYLKVSEGCDRLCTFCAIPNMRGKHASKALDEVIAEARQLADDGVRELVIVAQDTTYYGMDIYGEPRLAELLRELEQVQGIDWIRLMYFYPMYITDELVEVIAASDKIVPYIDMPLQHINNTMLRRMARRVTREKTEELLGKLREKIPQLTIRTTLISGFPGETDQQHAEVVEFVKQQRFERLGVFTYSLEPDTPAANLPDHVAEATMNARRDQLMAVQQEIAFEAAASKVGLQLEVILDQPLEGEENVWIGRTKADAPDVDAIAYVSGEDLQAGDIVLCEVVATDGYDLVAAAIGEPSRARQPGKKSADSLTVIS
jgi:ribosomal protein S12 methylthiotransferase